MLNALQQISIRFNRFLYKEGLNAKILAYRFSFTRLLQLGVTCTIVLRVLTLTFALCFMKAECLDFNSNGNLLLELQVGTHDPAN